MSRNSLVSVSLAIALLPSVAFAARPSPPAPRSTRAAVEATFRTQYAKAPHWTLALADTARHFVMLDSPEWTWARIDAFLAGDATASATGGGR